MWKQLFFLSLIVNSEAYKIPEVVYTPGSWPNSLKFLSFTGGLVGSYWGVTQLHAHYCAPSGLYGFFQTAFLMSTPICRTCLSVLNNVDSIYGAAWAGVFFSGLSHLKELSQRITNKDDIKSHVH